MQRGSGGAYGNAAITGGTGMWNDGTAAAPSFSWASAPTWGLYRTGGGVTGFAAAGAYVFDINSGGIALRSTGGIFWRSTTAEDSTADISLVRDGANILAQKNANVAQESRIYAGNGGFLSNVKSVTESLTIAAAATTVSATTIPAGAILLAVSVRVTTVIPTALESLKTHETGQARRRSDPRPGAAMGQHHCDL
jgi:hypothetical protein